MWSQDIYRKALIFAATAHKDQKIPGEDLPYIVHPANVCMEVMSALCRDPGINADLAVQCALLHDTIEDTSVGFTDIKRAFGRAVADGVLALTKDKTLSDKRLQLVDSLERIKKQPREIWIVKLADRITNLEAPPVYWTKQMIASYRGEAELILAALRNGSAFLAERLTEKIIDYEKYIYSEE